MLWAFDYKPNYFYELTPIEREINYNSESKEDKLIELKKIYEKGLITEEEYKKAKERILNDMK